jgi:ATP citrate (pro-S)-lyase
MPKPFVSFFLFFYHSHLITSTVKLMTQSPHPSGSKVLIVGGGIANFTNVAATFKGIIRALKEFQQLLISTNVSIFVRRGGPNWQEGLKAMRLLGESLGVKIRVFGPDTFITAIVPLALGLIKEGEESSSKNTLTSIAATPTGAETPANQEQADIIIPPSTGEIHPDGHRTQPNDQVARFPPAAAGSSDNGAAWYSPLTPHTRSLIYGLQPRAVQGMLDFDFSCGRFKPSVAGIIYPFGGHHIQKFYWGTQEVLIPVYTSLDEAMSKHPDVTVVVNFASSRSVYGSTMEVLTGNGGKWAKIIKVVAIIAEGVPGAFFSIFFYTLSHRLARTPRPSTPPRS